MKLPNSTRQTCVDPSSFCSDNKPLIQLNEHVFQAVLHLFYDYLNFNHVSPCSLQKCPVRLLQNIKINVPKIKIHVIHSSLQFTWLLPCHR